MPPALSLAQFPSCTSAFPCGDHIINCLFGSARAGVSCPGFHRQSTNLREMSYVIRDEDALQNHRMRGDEDIEISDRTSLLSQHATDSSKFRRRCFVERHDFHRRRERVDQAMEFSRSLSVSAVPKFSESNRAHAKVRWTACPDARAHAPLSAEGEADAVSIEEVFHDGSKGFRLDPIGLPGGLGMSSCHAPKQARNSAGHSSAGSRMTFLPTFLTITWS